MVRRHLLVAGVLGLLMLLLSGCSLRSPEELYSLPKPPSDYERLQNAITQVQQELGLTYSTTVEYAAPLSGVNIQPVQLLDLDDDGVQESAAAFFRVSGAENPLMIYIFRQTPDGDFAVYSVIEGGGSAVNSISYENLDDIPGKELVVQWQMNDDIHLLGAYSISSGAVRSLLITSYTECQVMDLDRDGYMELLLLHLDASTSSGHVDYYNYSGELDSMLLDSSANLSWDVVSISQVNDNYLQGMVPALYITSKQSSGNLVTDILTVGEQGLTNITLDQDSGVSLQTLTTKEVYGTDINSDSVLELPSLGFLPEYDNLTTNNYWLTRWNQYDETGAAHAVCTTYHNERDGWYLIIPDSWLGQLSIARTDNITLGERAVTFYHWNGDSSQLPVQFLTIYMLTGPNRQVRATQGQRFVLLEDSSTIYAAEFYSGWNCGLDQSSLLTNFNFIRTEW